MKILLDKLRRSKKYSYSYISIITDIPRTTIIDICKGRSVPKMDTMEELAKGLKVRIQDLYISEYK